MTPPEIPIFYNDLDLTLLEIQRLIAEGALNRKAASHHPVVATIDADGYASQRVMILRECDWARPALRFHTDLRSDKITHIAAQSNASALIYDEAAKLQIRLTGRLSLGTEEAAEQAWNASTEFARRCYMAQSAPGSEANEPMSGLPAWIEGKQPTLDMLIDARQNFAILWFEFDRIDWLYLANNGHRRAKFVRDSQSHAWNGNWLIP
jgi:pyridoxamine 5'-phosphate oxidase